MNIFLDANIILDLRAPLIIDNIHNGQCKCKIVQEMYES